MAEALHILADQSSLPFPDKKIVHPDFGRESSILDYREMVIESMLCFTDELNASQPSQYVLAFPRGDKHNSRSMPEVEFMLLPSLVNTNPDSVWGISFGDTIAGAICQDGDFGFSLSYTRRPQDKAKLLAIVSFMTPSKIRVGNYYGVESLLSSDFPDTTPIIVQLQGVSGEAYENEPDGDIFRKDAANMIQQFRWEEVLVRLTAAWAQSVGIKQLGILSASQNYYLNDIQFDRLHRRYDKTAERLGFTINSGSVHILDL